MCQDYIKRIFIVLISCLLIILNTASYALQDIIAGKHYKVLPAKVYNHHDIVQLRDKDPSKIQALMFFSYACYWCSVVNKPFDKWAKSKPDVAVYYLPVPFNRAFESLAKAYYTAEILDDTGKIDDAIFSGIHEERINYARESLLQELFEKHGISKEQFNNTYNSFLVNRKVNRAKELMKAYNISSTPNIIINGINSSYITNLSMAQDVDTLLATLDFIIAKENKLLKKQ